MDNVNQLFHLFEKFADFIQAVEALTLDQKSVRHNGLANLQARFIRNVSRIFDNQPFVVI
jgi:hypothetical protein